MSGVREPSSAADYDVVGRMLHDFNVEFEDPSPPPQELATRVRELVAGGDTRVLVNGDGPDGVAVLRFRRSLWTPGLECYLAELYVVPERRGHGLGRALMEAVLALAASLGADYIELGTEETDVAARSLYESLGFTNRSSADGARSLFYEREL
jgi:ribosomal protein S18 acetylase RimI-like enzyme